MKSDEELRHQVKIMKALQGVSYKELSEYLNITTSSFYNWLRGDYAFSFGRKAKLIDILSDLKE